MTTNFDDTKYPECPYCGDEYREAWELGLPDDDTEAKIICPNCSEEYLVKATINISYTGRRVVA